MGNHVYKGDLPDDLDLGKEIAIDTEATGLFYNVRDRLCLIQFSSGNSDTHMVQIEKDNYAAPNVRKLLSDDSVVKIFHYARFDMGILQKTFGIKINNVYCTKIASKLARTYTEFHGLKNIVQELMGVEISKREQSSDWASDEITKQQIKYAANDVLYLHEIKEKLTKMLEREGRMELAQKCFDFLPIRVELDLEGWDNSDIFNHS